MNFSTAIELTPTSYIVDDTGKKIKFDKAISELNSMVNKDWTEFYMDEELDVFLYQLISTKYNHLIHHEVTFSKKRIRVYWDDSEKLVNVIEELWKIKETQEY